MYGRPSRSSGGAWGHPPPVTQPLNPNFSLQNPNTPYIYPLNPAFTPQHHQAYLNFSPNNLTPPQNPSFAPQQFSHPPFRPPRPQNSNELLEKVDRAVAKARSELIAASESVSAWKVSQSALLMLQIDGWGSLGFQMQQVPSLQRLMFTEGKINAYIQCFVAVRRISSLSDLEVAICKNEGIEKFEELGLGPLVQHPLVLHYYSVKSDTEAIYKITSDEIISLLSDYMDTCKNKEIKIEEFLDFIVKKRSVASKEELGIRIQSFGMHISAIRDVKKIEQSFKNTFKKNNKRYFSLKRQLDERFSDISQRVESFSSVQKFCGKHVRFDSLKDSDADSSGDDLSEDDDEVNDHSTSNPAKLSSKSVTTSDRAGRCPYPSELEEKNRLGLYQNSPASCSQKHSESNRSSKKKRNCEDVNSAISVPAKLRKREKVGKDSPRTGNGRKTNEVRNLDENDLSITNTCLKTFITTWKEACRESTVAEVLDKLLQLNNTDAQKKKEIKSMFSVDPLIGLLNVAVSSIKSGLWDSMYDTFQIVGQLTDKVPDNSPEYVNIDVEPSIKDEKRAKDAPVIPEQAVEPRQSAFVEDIIKKITMYFELDRGVHGNGRSLQEKICNFLTKLCRCELWLVEEFSVKEFRSLGHGEFLRFLENYAGLLPSELCKFLNDDGIGKCPLEVCMLQHHLVILLSQALSSLWEDENITKQEILLLLRKQFPSVSLKIIENGSVEDFLSIVEKHKNDVISKCVLFSMALNGTSYGIDSSVHYDYVLLKGMSVSYDSGPKAETHESVTSKDAIKVLARAPMMSDLNSWSHWDLLFAPSLGPLIPWLLNEVNTDELLCLVTKDGKVIRLDQSASVDSFVEAALQGSSFHTALNMLSLFSLVGGEKHAPVPLLKIHIQHAFEVILKNFVDNMEVHPNNSSLNFGKALSGHKMIGEVAAGQSSHRDLHKTDIGKPIIARFFLECLAYLPAEFRCFAADVLLSGMQSVVKHASSAILSVCSKLEQRIMLHEVGLSLGIVEWINDYHAFLTNDTTQLFMSGTSCSNALGCELGLGSKPLQDVSEKFVISGGSLVGSVREGVQEVGCTDVSLKIGGIEICNDTTGSGHTQHSAKISEHEDASQVIESIRRDEFGLHSSQTTSESVMLKKHHARLGRALHCLSQELYSQDSHFLLELVQNADDNTYSTSIEPTLTFILQDSGIIVLNNEQGFSAENIRALCDVGSSTKKGSNAGYIGRKGIGFKSVFRVTDAPEIHSNGFHIKFDISQGQIGFLLPTVVPPCNIDILSRLTSSDCDQPESNVWNTCIVLPFRSKFSDGSVMKSIINMFSDLHPSILLFLHRLQCIKFRNLLDNTLTVMRKETVGDGIVKVSHGKEKMTWFLVSQKLRADFRRSDVQTTEISIAFTLKELDDGVYGPDLGQQPAFAFLPLRTYGLKFILQGDFVLPSSREEVDGDSPWNQWLLSEFPGLFVNAERSFCSLSCFKENPGRGVASYMSFVPLVGEVHGFFASLPRLIISKLRMSNCLLVEGGNDEWVPPCKVLRGWNEQARLLLPDNLLREHLGLGLLDKNIVLPDSLARALGIAEYGPKILLQVMDSLCRLRNGLSSMGLGWLTSWLSELYAMSFNASFDTSFDSGLGMDLLDELRKIPFIPLSDGSYGAIDKEPIWLHFDASSTGFEGQHGLESFPNLYANLRIVSPAFLSTSIVDMPSMDVTTVDKQIRMLRRIGVQQLSAHDIVKVHILPAISDDRIAGRDKNLMTEYLCFVMVHLQSTCSDCHGEMEYIISELRNKAYILTNHGFQRPAEISIHFSKEFGNPLDIKKLINMTDMKWLEVDTSYLKHPVTKTLQCGLTKWREFFQQIGIMDFVKVVPVEKGFDETCKDLISLESDVTDWESPELVELLSLLIRKGEKEGCQYLLKVLDSLWDECYLEKAAGSCASENVIDKKPFKSSFIHSICDAQWVVSTMDNALHYPKDLYHDCDAVRAVLGLSAPFSIPKVGSGKFASSIGFKTVVSVDDGLEVLKLWRCENPFKASTAQMSKFYTLIWNEMASSKLRIVEEFRSKPSIFVPYASSSRHADVVSGAFLSPEEVYWHESTSFMDQIKHIHPQCSSTGLTHGPLIKILCNFYPGLHDFFVNVCGVPETPPLRSYLQILLHLSKVALPSQAANAVFQVFLMWTDGLKSGLSPEDIVSIRDSLKKMECMVLPTVHDKWVSLHPSFGLVCWCDDKKLSKQFKHLDGLDFLNFGQLTKDNEEILCTKMPNLMQTLGIPALSQVVTREAIYYGLQDSSYEASLVNSALPYAQRYLHSLHPDKYSLLKQSGFDILNCLQVIVVEELYYRNVIEVAGSESKKRVACTCLLKGSMLYTTRESDSHTLFLELSRLFFNGNPELHLANFLHIISTMEKSGSNEEQIELFILNSQKVPKLPDGECVWSLSSLHSLTEDDKSLQTSNTSTEVNEPTSWKPKRKAENWPPVDWKTAPGFAYARAHGFKTHPPVLHPYGALENLMDGDSVGIVGQDNLASVSVDTSWTLEDYSATASLALPETNDLLEHCSEQFNDTNFATHIEFDPINLGLVSDLPEFGSSSVSKREQLRYGTPNATQAIMTGRLGEHVAFKYFVEKAGESAIKWVNEHKETGLPYDIVLGEKNKKYIEVKATKSARKDWFEISMKELQFAIEKGEAFSIAHVILLDNNVAKVRVYNNLAKLCQLRQLKLAVLIPVQQKEFTIVSQSQN
ncbi:protein NO VEIN [Argentina anserina]|uniref:protein NO VEIN n=1 Tax=Argentina anserina TaxID=57926 RepID=UPI0021766BF9|nr:protein NO VEIN [Potentilla anserina]